MSVDAGALSSCVYVRAMYAISISNSGGSSSSTYVRSSIRIYTRLGCGPQSVPLLFFCWLMFVMTIPNGLRVFVCLLVCRLNHYCYIFAKQRNSQTYTQDYYRKDEWWLFLLLFLLLLLLLILCFDSRLPWLLAHNLFAWSVANCVAVSRVSYKDVV